MSEPKGPRSEPTPLRRLPRLLLRVAVLIAGAGAAAGVFFLPFGLMGLFYFYPAVLVAYQVGGNILVALTITHNLVPLGFMLAFWWPWWVRWAAAGVLTFNVVILALYVWPYFFR